MGGIGDYISEFKEKADAVFLSHNKDLLKVDMSLKHHWMVLKEHNKSLEQVYNLILTLEGRLQSAETVNKNPFQLLTFYFFSPTLTNVHFILLPSS